MGTFIYELQRALKSKTVIILTVAVIAISVFSAINGAVSNPTPYTNDTSTAYGYGSNGTYSIVVHVQNGYGQALQNSKVSVKLEDHSNLAGNTNKMGYANFTISGVNNTVIGNPKNSGQWGLSYNYTNSRGTEISWILDMFKNSTNPYFFSVENTYALPNGTTETGFQSVPRYVLNSINVQNQPTYQSLNILYEGNISQVSPNVELYVLPINGTIKGSTTSVGYSSNQITEQNMTLLGSYSGFSHLTVNTMNLTGSNVNFYVFALFTPGGERIALLGVTTYTPQTVNQVTNQFYGTQMSIMGLFIPLMAAVAAYSTYGKDKVGGVIESVLVRPVSRRALIISRYLATLSAVFVATIIAFLISSGVYDFYLGNTITTATFISGLWSLLVITAAYVGLVYLASSFAKSSGMLIGVVIALFMVFDFFWTFSGAGIIPFITASLLLNLPSGGMAYTKAIVDMYYISPAGLPNITSLLITGSAYYQIYARNSDFVQLGLTWTNVVIVGALWIAVPLLLSVLAFIKRG